jgi:hypothetical protein
MAEVKKAMYAELDRANKEKPLFASNHEGAFVILEEIAEASADAKRVNERFKLLMESVFRDQDRAAEHQANKVKESAIYAACEYIQVAAMCEKFNMKDDYFPQEHVDELAKYAPEEEIFEDYKKLKAILAKLRKENGYAE